MDLVLRLGRRIVDVLTPESVHLARLLEDSGCGFSTPAAQPQWVRLFERHPDVKVVDYDTTDAICQALRKLRSVMTRPDGLARSPLLYFTSFGGSGKSRFCGRFGAFVTRLQQEDPAAAAALRATPADDASPVFGTHSSATLANADLVSWSQQLRLVGLNFSSTHWGLGFTDQALVKHGLFIPLYLRILFFSKGDLRSDASSLAWKRLGARCLQLLQGGLITQYTLAGAVDDLLQDLVGPTVPRRPLVILVDEIAKVDDHFADHAAGVAARYRSQLCRIADSVGGHVVFSSVYASLLMDETRSSGRPVQELLKLPLVSTAFILAAALRHNAQRGVFLSYDGSVASWKLSLSDTHALSDRGVAGLACLVGDDARFATMLARYLMAAPVGTGAVWTYVVGAAEQSSFALPLLWDETYWAVVFAHVLLDREVAANRRVRGGVEPVTWDQVRLRGLVHAVGGARFVPKLPLFALWYLLRQPTVDDSTYLHRGICRLLSWSSSGVSWCGWETFFEACLMVLDNARAVLSQGCNVYQSLARLFPSETHQGVADIIKSDSVDAAQPRLNVRTATLGCLMRATVDGDQQFVNYVYKLNQCAAAIDAAVLYQTRDGQLSLLCIQLKFSSQHASTSLSWAESCRLVQAMQKQAAEVAAHSWADVRGRVAFLVGARCKRGARYAADRAACPASVMDSAVVLCWEDLRNALGPFLVGLADHAETIFEAEVQDMP